MTFHGIPVHFGNYHYSLPSNVQSAIQLWLRFLPEEYKTESWQILHELTYATDWTGSPTARLVCDETGKLLEGEEVAL
jgi:hypothetical protein